MTPLLTILVFRTRKTKRCGGQSAKGRVPKKYHDGILRLVLTKLPGVRVRTLFDGGICTLFDGQIADHLNLLSSLG